ncbi:MAG: hypothetical protein NVSMB47_11800 [Polyangiales bacterium]
MKLRLLLVSALLSALSIAALGCPKTDASKSDDKSTKSDKADKKKSSGDDDDDDDNTKSKSKKAKDDSKPNKADKADGKAIRIDCNTTFNDLLDKGKMDGKSGKVACPGGCNVAPYGSGWYTTDSSICTAAIHAGAIDPDDGGDATVTLQKGLDSYKASHKHGIQSSAWEKFDKSFNFNDGDNLN